MCHCFWSWFSNYQPVPDLIVENYIPREEEKNEIILPQQQVMLLS
jgi:hypothetical protein